MNSGIAAKTKQAWADKEVFTTGDAAKICHISQQSIIRCFDSGRLKGFKVPNSRFRRIPRVELIRFMKANDIPTDVLGVVAEKDLRTKVLLCGINANMFARLADSSDFKVKCRYTLFTNLFDAGLYYQAEHPRIVILGSVVQGDHVEVANIIMRRFSQVEKVRVIVICNKVSEARVRKRLDYSHVRTFVGTPDEFVPFVLQYVPNG